MTETPIMEMISESDKKKLSESNKPISTSRVLGNEETFEIQLK